MVPSQQLSSQAGAKMPRYQDFLRARGHLVSLVRFPWAAWGSKNRPFWYPDTKMARYHENLLFTIQKLCFQGAKATKISIFWYPKTPPKQLSGRAGAKMGWGGGAKPAAKQPSWCQDAKISRFPSRARPSAPTGAVSQVCLGDPKSTILVPRYQNG